MWRGVFRLLVIPLFVVVAPTWLWLRSPLPYGGERLVLPGLEAEVRINRDEHGIPTIIAANDRDSAFALGFLHAQDRLFQMDAMRHYGAGRLSEWFGSRTVAIDRFTRTLGFYRAAEKQYANLSDEAHTILEAYAAGVNAYLSQRRDALPPEYYLLGIRPEPWRPADTLVWGKIMALQLAGNFRSELLHARLAQRLKPEEMAVLYPPYPKDGAVALGDATKWLDGLPLDAIYATLPDLVGPHFASNNWVVSGSHTSSGKPLLANDPHLGFSAPSVWYLARIETPTAKLAGVTAPGVPIVILGHNSRIAWGFTTTTSDVEDVFIERIDPADPRRYLAPDGPRPFDTRQEQVKVKGAEPVTITIRATRHGPVISDLGGRYGQPASSNTVLALQTTWLGDDDRTPEALWHMSHANNWSEFRDALKDFVAPQQNIVYADIDGNIGFVAPARVPIRAKGDGWMPAPGWTSEYDWTGYIPFDALPSVLNPPSGRIVSANNKIVPDSYPYFLGRGWDIPNRADRINQMLDAVATQSVDTFAAMQADTLSLMAKDLLPLMLQAPSISGRAAQALDRLRAWDGRMDRDKVAPLLFTAWLRELDRTLFADRLGSAFEDYWDTHPDVVHLILTTHPEWCDNPTTEAIETCADALTHSLERALAQLAERYGQDMNDWRWGRAHEATFTNQFWANVPVLRDLLALAVPADGGYDTVNRGNTAIHDTGNPYADVHGATLRMIVDLSDIEATRFMISPGESGNPLSPHYGDLMRSWRDFAYFTFGAKQAVSMLVLAPP